MWATPLLTWLLMKTKCNSFLNSTFLPLWRVQLDYYYAATLQSFSDARRWCDFQERLASFCSSWRQCCRLRPDAALSCPQWKIPPRLTSRFHIFDLHHCVVAAGLSGRLHSCSPSASQIIAIIVKLSGPVRRVHTRPESANNLLCERPPAPPLIFCTRGRWLGRSAEAHKTDYCQYFNWNIYWMTQRGSELIGRRVFAYSTARRVSARHSGK